MKKYWSVLGKRLLAVAVCLTMLVAVAPSAYANDELDALNDKYDQLDKQQKELQSKIDKAKTDKDKQVAIKNKTTSDIAILEGQIAVLKEKIVVMEREIAAKEEEIAGLSSDIDANYALFKERMRAMYMSDTSTTIGLVLGADSYGDYLARSEMVTRVASHDRELIAGLTAAKENIESIKADLSKEQDDLNAAKQSVEAKNTELDGRLAATVSQIQDLDSMEKEFLANKAELQQEMKNVQADLDAVYASLQLSTDEFVGGVFCQPVPGYSKITSYYGWRFGGSDFHTGIDFSGTNVLGKNVVAGNTGTVVVTNESFVNGKRGGYGRYIMVDHGGGYTTLYGHLSKIDVSVGDQVRKGEPIGKVGSTGWSTGPHLHFEVRINGKHQNPLNYL